MRLGGGSGRGQQAVPAFHGRQAGLIKLPLLHAPFPRSASPQGKLVPKTESSVEDAGWPLREGLQGGCISAGRSEGWTACSSPQKASMPAREGGALGLQVRLWPPLPMITFEIEREHFDFGSLVSVSVSWTDFRYFLFSGKTRGDVWGMWGFRLGNTKPVLGRHVRARRFLSGNA